MALKRIRHRHVHFESRKGFLFRGELVVEKQMRNLLGTDIENGLIPNDEAFVGQMVKNICYGNAKAYLGLARS